MSEPLDPELGEGFSLSPEGLTRLRIELAYDGADFCGWAKQPGLRSVQGELEDALVLVLRLDNVRTVCAGRTDAGVHASGQTVHLDVPHVVVDLDSSEWADRVARRLNSVLPDDIAIKGLEVAAPGFDARFSVRRRRYRYRVTDRGVDPLVRGFVVQHPDPLDLHRMNQASALLLGEHDFAAFCREREGTSSVRTLHKFHWSRESTGVVVADLEADAFCHSMVRSLVGALLPVGDGRQEVTWPAEILTKGQRTSAVKTAPAHGLVLSEVEYAADELLAHQAQVSRRWRGNPDENPIQP